MRLSFSVYRRFMRGNPMRITVIASEQRERGNLIPVYIVIASEQRERGNLIQ
ncbi:hypothetical protein [Pumilibacter intestinalis]|uniref:hypothetical protein n=1 Tax=Pumilibacter intestinalis TaxID=2941511 RepID=UPI002041EB14|nr:hypothetical protein [Pumilibacter intestinalis]